MPTRIIAEVTSNHGGDLGLAREFIRAAAHAGVDYVKFQSWRAATVRGGRADPQYDWFVRAELSDEAHRELIEECGRAGVQFLTTCFDVDRVDFLASLGMDAIKVGSPDLTSQRMLEALRRRFRHVIVSTGVGTDEEVLRASEWLRGGDFTLLHCVSLYPMPVPQAHLERMHWLRQFTPSVGWSDHAEGLEVAKLAIAAGANYLEKHYCLGRTGPGRAMSWDATPEEFAELVAYAARVDTIMGKAAAPSSPELVTAKARFVGRWGNNA
jgi:N,N'-diacetyllegionaminate synthase